MKRQHRVTAGKEKKNSDPCQADPAVETFPVLYSTLSSEALREKVLKKYPHNNSIICEYLYRGLNDNYLVRDGDEKYILRVYRYNWRDRRDIESEMELLLYLKENGVSVSAPVTDVNMDLIQEIQAPEGKRYAVLFSYAKGSSPLNEITMEQSRTAGRELAKMHSLTINRRLKNNRCYLDIISLLYESFYAIKPFIEDRKDNLSDLEEIILKLKSRFESISLEDLSSGICHGDLYPANYHFSGDSEITFFDFDASCCSWFVLDVAAFCYATSQYYADADRINKAFIDGYKEVRELTDKEIGLIPYFGAVRQLWVLGTQCSNFEIFCHFVRTNIKRNIIANLKKYVELHCP